MIKKAIYLVILVTVISTTLFLVLGGFVFPKPNFEFEGRYDYLGSVDDAQFYTTGYDDVSVYEFSNNKTRLIYEGANIEEVKLLTEQIIIFESGKTKLIDGFITNKILSIDIKTKKQTEISYSAALDVHVNKFGFQTVVGETDDYIIYKLTDRVYVDHAINYDHYLYFIDKDSNQVAHRLLLEYVSGSNQAQVKFMVKDNEIAYTSENERQFALYEINLDDFTITELSLNDTNYMFEWNTETCIIVLNELSSTVCKEVDDTMIQWMEPLINEIAYPYASTLILTDDYFVSRFSDTAKIYNLDGELLEEKAFRMEYPSLTTFDGDLVYIDRSYQDFIFVRARIQMITYDPFTGKTSKSKALKYDPEYVEFDGGV